MSFSSNLKSELSKIEILSPCCKHAQVYGLVLFAHFSKYNLSITTENPDVFDMYLQSIRACGVTPVINETGSKKLTAYVRSEEEKSRVFAQFGHTLTEPTLRLNRANLADECCTSAFLRGVFLSCGTVTDPERGYHLEFVVPYKRLSTDLMKLLNELELSPKSIVRKGNHIVYFKDSESIEDLLTFIGASDASLYVMNIKIEKDMKNKINRLINFEMSNLNKTLDASTEQIAAIEFIRAHGGISLLPEQLQELAILRLENSDASLSTLQSLLSEPISRSGINHRLARIVEFADRLRTQL
ncbi:MAG: DNA-binding protein WhiA [Clostridia bacterium]|nr:DNA-binding protein WhiA [Clostridia bacterium]